MALPSAPKKAEQATPSTTVATAAPAAAVAQPVAETVATETVATETAQRKIVQFAAADTPMPSIGGFVADQKTFVDLYNAIAAVVPIDDITAAMDTLSKDKVPGSKMGRNVYSVCNAIANIKGCYDRMTGVAAVRQSNSKVHKLEAKLKSLAALIDPEKAKALGIDIADLLG